MKEVRRRLSAWLVPTLLGPVLSSALLVTLKELSGISGVFGVARWLALVGAAGVAALALGVCLLLVDWVLLLFRRRIPPTGKRAWISGALAPLPAYGIWILLRPPLLSTPSSHALALAGALISSAILMRLVASERSKRRFRFI